MTTDELEKYKGTGFYKYIPVYSTREVCWKIKGIEDKSQERAVRNILLGNFEFLSEVEANEYCDELKQFIKQGYFEIEYCDGALTKRIDIPQGWKPKIHKILEEDSKLIKAKRKPFKNWFSRNGLIMLSVGGLLLGILGVVFSLVF